MGSRNPFKLSRMRHIREILETGETLTDKQRDTLLELVDKEIESKGLDVSLAEFHRWIRLGELVLTNVEKELADLRALAVRDGETISRPVLYDILCKYQNYKPKNEVDEGVNWVLGKVKEEVDRVLTKQISC